MLSEEEKRKIRILQNDYHRKWRKQNPDKVQAINDRFWRKKLTDIELQNRKDEQ